MVVLRRLVPNSLYPARVAGNPGLTLEVIAASQVHGSTAALLLAIDHALTTAALFKAVSIMSQRSVTAT